MTGKKKEQVPAYYTVVIGRECRWMECGCPYYMRYSRMCRKLSTPNMNIVNVGKMNKTGGICYGPTVLWIRSQPQRRTEHTATWTFLRSRFIVFVLSLFLQVPGHRTSIWACALTQCAFTPCRW